ncbi:ABC transporter permease [Oleiharenicola lentus]|uniref:Transport permease protein n=1 Tax=Oleiharenicola lentus TaxID=2508720 RepID=A0A4Q1CBM6_9BACT|nr:ABC transporter permease [Oleiharenicola lentus]RXK56513.1 ABC transporter permease [Oleiharenicola lentus]
MSQPPTPELVLEAGRSSRHYWSDLWRYRELLGFLAWRDIKVRYKQAALGIAWAVIQPVVQTVLLTFVFGKLAKMPDGGLPYPLIVLAGLLPWQLFTSAFNGAGNSLVGNSHLISKVYFPRLVVPLSSLAVALIDFGIMLVLTLTVMAGFGIYPAWQLLLLPLFLLLGLLIALGAGLWIAALTVKFRDFRFITPFILQIGMFVTPVGFRTDHLPNWRDLLALNPLAGVVDGVRWSLLGGRTELYLPGLASSVVVAAILLVTGLWYFRKTERQFADII